MHTYNYAGDKTFMQFLEKHFILRNKDDHIHYCTLIQNDVTGTKSKEYGMN